MEPQATDNLPSPNSPERSKKTGRDVFKAAWKFLRGILNRNFFVFLFFLALSAGFWLFLSMEEVYEVDVPVSVSLKNVPENVVITTPLPASVSMRLKDRGSTLMRYRWDGTIGSIVVDFSEFDMHSGHVRIPTADVAKAVTQRLLSSTTVLGFTPDTLEYFYNFGLTKQVPVKVVGNITADSLYCIMGSRATPKRVTVYASREILDTLSAVYTRPLNLTDLREDVTVRTRIDAMPGVKVVPEKVRARIFVDRMTENSLPVKVEYINFPAGKTLRTFPGYVNVVFQVGMQKYKEITPDKFAIVVSYQEVMASTDGKLHLHLKSQPANVSHVRLDPEDVDFLIEDSGEE